MRLWFSVAVLLVFTCVVIEISAAKSKREADVSRDNSKSTDAKEVRNFKNKSEHQKKGEGREQEVGKDKKRRSVEGSKNIDGVEVSKKNKKERDVKSSKSEQKSPKSNRQEKIAKNQQVDKKEKTIVKVDKEIGKKQKRSVESETVTDDATSGSAKKQEYSASKKSTKSKSEKKSRKTVDVEEEGGADADASADAIPKKTAQSDIKTKSSKTEEEILGEKQAKKQKNHRKNEEKVKPKKHEKIQTPDQRDEELGNSKYLNDTPEKSYYLNEDGLIKEKQSGGKHEKKHKYPKKSSEFVPACEKEGSDEAFPEQRAQPHKFDKCEVEAKCSPDKNIEDTEKSKYFADSELDEVDNESPESEADQESTEES